MTAYTWKSGTSGARATAADWAPAGGPPDAVTADATICANANNVITLGAGTSEVVDSLLLCGGSLVLGGTLTLGGSLAALTLAAGALDLSGTIIGGAVTVTAGASQATGIAALITGALAVDGGILGVASKDILTIGGALTLNNAAASSVNGPRALVTEGLPNECHVGTDSHSGSLVTFV